MKNLNSKDKLKIIELNYKVNNSYKLIIESKDNLLSVYDIYLNIVSDIESNINESIKENNIDLACKLKEMLCNFKLNSIDNFYNKISKIEIRYSGELEEDENIYISLIKIFNELKNKEIANENHTKKEKDYIINKLNNKINLLENRNIYEKRKFELDKEFSTYYTYKLFIQTLYDLLNDSYISDDGIYYYPFIDVDSFFILLIILDGSEYFESFMERNKIKNIDIIYDCINDDKNKNRKYLLNACYREIQGFKYSDKLIDDIAKEENVILGYDVENPLTLKIE